MISMLFRKPRSNQFCQLEEEGRRKAQDVHRADHLFLNMKDRHNRRMEQIDRHARACYERMEQLLIGHEGLRQKLCHDLLDRPDALRESPFADVRLGERLMIEGLITSQQLEYALAHQHRHGGRIGDSLVQLGIVQENEINDILNRSFKRRLIGELLVRSGELTQDQLNEALSYQQSKGGDLGEILISLNMVSQAQVYRALATQNQMGRLSAYNHDEALRFKLPEHMARQWHALVIGRAAGSMIVAVERRLIGDTLNALAAQLDSPVVQVLASPWEMEAIWDDIYQRELLEESTERLIQEQPDNSAHRTFTLPQLVGAIVLAVIITAALLWNWFGTLVLLNIFVQLVYFALTVTKFVIILYGSKETAQLRFSPEQIAAIDEKELPMYTILVPMYKESSVIPDLVRHLEAIDYPKNKLDIRLLIEADDLESKQVIESLNLPLCFQLIVVPDGQPKTKPKACNYGLIRARGDYVVIFDAEDRPDADQLKKVFLAFRDSPKDTVCIQAKLNYFNSGQNLLTRFFTQEYSNWFELLLPGVMTINLPIPLGGTSNHFKTALLRKLGAWDPYNVTEDADLGIRLYKHRYTTRVVDSRTLEEANSRYGNWIRQRSRWIKGYMQTWLVHMRHPLKLYRDLGLKGFWGAQFMLQSAVLLPLLNPIFWSLLVIWYVSHAGWIPSFFPGIIYYLAAAQLLIGNFLFIYTNMAGTYWVVHDLHQKNERWLSYGLVKYALLTPFYWTLMSVASYKALWQLIRKPFYWEKTVHGFDKSQEPLQQPFLGNHQSM
ncbi:MAG: glycosyltransferase family 2 protein [Sporolactobacillus sp.]